MATATASDASTPWSHVVRGEAEESTLKLLGSEIPAGNASGDSPGSAVPSANAIDQEEMNSAWKTVSGAAISAGPVMGAESWPALSEAIKIPLKSPSSDSLKGLANGSVTAPPASVNTSPKRNAAISSTNNPILAKQKGPKRHGGGILPEAPVNASDKAHVSGPSIKEVPSRTGDLDHGPRPGGSDNLRSHSSTRRGNIVGNGGQIHNSFGNNRPFGGLRDVHSQHQQQQRPIVRPFLRPQPPGPAPFIPPPPPIRPFANHIGYHDIPSPVFYVPPPLPESWRGVPFVPPAPIYFAPPDMQLRSLVLQQIEYYFSPENLCRDVFLRQNMDDEGWVPVNLVSGFRRVASLTNNIPLILDTVRGSTVVEVQGDKLRRRNDWRNWPPLSTSASPRHQTTSVESVAVQLSHAGLGDENSREQMWATGFGRSSSGPKDGANSGN